MFPIIREKVPCVGCGYCCIRQTCTFGICLHPESKNERCPELKWTGSRYVCRLLERPGRMTDFYKMELQVGEGCASYCNPWRLDVKER